MENPEIKKNSITNQIETDQQQKKNHKDRSVYFGSSFSEIQKKKLKFHDSMNTE